MTGCINALHREMTLSVLSNSKVAGGSFKLADGIAAELARREKLDQITFDSCGTFSGLRPCLKALAPKGSTSLTNGADMAGPLGAACLASVTAGASASVR